MVPKSGKEKKLRDKLKELYGHMEESGMDDDGSGSGPAGMLDNLGEYYPYVSVAF